MNYSYYSFDYSKSFINYNSFSLLSKFGLFAIASCYFFSLNSCYANFYTSLIFSPLFFRCKRYIIKRIIRKIATETETIIAIVLVYKSTLC